MYQKSLIGSVVLVLLAGGLAKALDHVSFRREDERFHVSGQVLVEAVDGGLLLEDPAGRIWAVTAEELEEHRQDESTFEPFGEEAMANQLMGELPNGFRIHKTAHYVICYNTSQAYARWCGALFERLYFAFTTFWRERGMSLSDPQGPLVALLFDRKGAYAEYSREELGDATSAVIGYFSLRTNRMTTYDLTGVDALRGGTRVRTAEHINRILSRPQAEQTVATIIHEATHQLAFNCGLQTRYADIPLWVSEGIAVYFETPDLRSKRGWRNIGAVNRRRLYDFRRYLGKRPSNSLLTLLSNDERFRNTQTAPAAYAEAWALNYFLLKKYREEYVQYLKTLSERRPLIYDEPHERVEAFRQALGDDLGKLDVEFLRYMQTVR